MEKTKESSQFHHGNKRFSFYTGCSEITTTQPSLVCTPRNAHEKFLFVCAREPQTGTSMLSFSFPMMQLCERRSAGAAVLLASIFLVGVGA